MKALVIAAVLSLHSTFAANPAQPPQGQAAPPVVVRQIQTFKENQLVKYFIDDTVVAVPIDFNMDTLADIAQERHFLFNLRKAYRDRCNERHSTDLSTFKPVFLNECCPVELTTNTDFTDVIGLMSNQTLCSFAKLPPGPLRKAMYERVSQNDELKDDFFTLKRFGDVVEEDIFPECLIDDAIILFNESLKYTEGYISKIACDRYEELAKFILPSSYFKIARIESDARKKIGKACLKAFINPIPGTEHHFNSENFFNIFLETFAPDENMRTDYVEQVIQGRPLLALNHLDEIDNSSANFAISALIKMRENGNKALKLAEPHLAEFVAFLRDTARQENKLENAYEDIILNINQDDEDLPCKKVHITASHLFDNGTASLPSEFAQLFDTKICSMVNKAHSISSMTTNYSNPKVFFKMLNRAGGWTRILNEHYFAQMYHLMKPFMSARKLEYCRTFARLNSINLFSVGCEKIKKLPKTNYKIRSMLNSLFFHIGCFGDHMDEGMREMLEAVAELYYPHEVARLKAVIKLVGLTPNIVDLIQMVYIDRIWIFEFYGKLYDAEPHNDMVNVFDNKGAFDKLKSWIADPHNSDKNSSLMSQLRKEQIVEKLESLGRHEQAEDLRKHDPKAFRLPA